VFSGFTGYMTSHGYTNASNVDWKGIGLRYRAQGVPPLRNILNAWTDASFNASIFQGVDRLIQYISDEYIKCGTSEKFVLAGYSQGALAIHLYLTLGLPSYILNQIAAVGFVADPSKNKAGAESIYTNNWEDAKAAQDTPIINATGIYSKAQMPGSGSLPGAITGRSATLCYNHDIVCAPTALIFGSSGAAHGSYSTGDLNNLGAWLADTAIASGLPTR